MENLSVEAAVKKIQIYLRQDNFRPYFVIVDGAAECEKLKKFFKNYERIYLSKFCRGDTFPDPDEFIDTLKTVEKNALCFGLGEYVFFTANENILRTLQDRNFNRKIIFICRGIANLLESLADADFKFRTNNICKIAGVRKFSVVKFGANIDVPTDAKNFSELLKLMESGKCDSLSVKTNLPLAKVKEINTFYDAIKNREPRFTFRADVLDEEQWREYFLDDKCDGFPPEHWRTFAAGFKNKFANSYLQYVFSISANYEAYRQNLFFALLEVTDEKIFGEFYPLRKTAVKNISAQYVAEYLERLKNFAAGSNAIKFLTDNTAEERRAMIQAVQGKEKIPAIFKQNFSAMEDYLTDYDFGDEEITRYFRRYKKIKVCNVDDADFKNLVQKFAVERPANKFETRRAILDRADDTAKLYWLDALGVEFLSYIQARASQNGLSVRIEIARAELPTLTSQNKNFYDDWRGDKFDKNSKLDELKHSPEQFDASGKCSAPTYIDDEFKIIDEVISEIKIALAQQAIAKIILTSDHGASRLAVMYGRENKHKINSVGEHAGRCCPISECDEKPNFATEENGRWVLANYDRFSGGRLDSVEVHGGATLEEILVPVIEFSLQGAKITVEPSPEKISASSKKSDDAFEFFE
ncbi:MAG: BREX-4 system phosphatase PglZ [Selenomonadaceae bacterium]|nr:BREX-4 system phosphatase PglZ [Selenomonadaceae bacterium]